MVTETQTFEQALKEAREELAETRDPLADLTVNVCQLEKYSLLPESALVLKRQAFRLMDEMGEELAYIMDDLHNTKRQLELAG